MEVNCGGCELNYFDSVGFTEDDIHRFLIKHSVINQETNCPKCGNTVRLQQGSWVFRCNKTQSQRKQRAKKCTWRGYARANSFYTKSKLNIIVLWRLINHFLFHNPPRQPFLIEQLGLPPRTIVDWFSFVREVFVDHLNKSSTQIGGVGEVVEIDEAKFGKRKYNRGKRVKGNWVLGGVERGSGRSFLVPVKDRSRKTLVRLIRRWVRPGTQIITDCWKSYDRLSSYGFEHLTVNHSKTFKDPITGAHTNKVERGWRDVRDHIPKYGVKSKHFAGYLAEYMFKKRFSSKERPHQFYKAAASLYPPKY